MGFFGAGRYYGYAGSNGLAKVCSSFFFSFCNALSSKLKLVEDRKAFMVDKQMSFSVEFLYKTAAERAKDAKSLAGSWKIVDRSNTKEGSRNIRISLRPL